MNRPHVEIIHSPVSAVVKQMYDDYEEFKDVEVVMGGFPCQGFSSLCVPGRPPPLASTDAAVRFDRNHDKHEYDRRVDEPFNWLACIEETMPLIAIFESTSPFPSLWSDIGANGRCVDVMGIMDCPLPNQVSAEGGLLSLVLENLVNLGYQFQFNRLNSAAFVSLFLYLVRCVSVLELTL